MSSKLITLHFISNFVENSKLLQCVVVLCKVIIEKSRGEGVVAVRCSSLQSHYREVRGEGSLMDQDTIENVS